MKLSRLDAWKNRKVVRWYKTGIQSQFVRRGWWQGQWGGYEHCGTRQERSTVLCGWMDQGKSGYSQPCCSSTPARSSKLPQECDTWCQLFAKLSVWALEQLSSAIGGGARVLVRQPKTAVFKAEIEVQIYRTPALKVLKLNSPSSKVLMQCFPTFCGLRFPTEEKYKFAAPNGNLIAICFKVWWHLENVFLIMYWKIY